MLHSGHAPGHVRDTFLDAIHAFMQWNDGEPEPTVGFEVNYVERQIPISKACALVWCCTDIMPSLLFNWLCEALDVEPRRQTYAAAARAMRRAIKQ